MKCTTVRNDKYSAKVYKYFVEYSDKEAKKKTYTETEKTKSTAHDEAHIYMHICHTRCSVMVGAPHHEAHLSRPQTVSNWPGPGGEVHW